jgi:two-component system, chemotaxis family, protein-glutamate methylesterase/glutaminase
MTNPEASASAATYRDINLIEASSGSIEALKPIIKDLPADFPAAVFIVNHISIASFRNQIR